MRAYAGAGFAYGRDGNGYEQTLPFYKAFFAGGPNSMRGWQVRQLGLGSSKFYDTAGQGPHQKNPPPYPLCGRAHGGKKKNSFPPRPPFRGSLGPPPPLLGGWKNLGS